ncbi:hypothetical protein IG631_18695 [Alternaria alternata]|nr:hypothetical protein IG631_18695 [Alternaria alternata]
MKPFATATWQTRMPLPGRGHSVRLPNIHCSGLPILDASLPFSPSAYPVVPVCARCLYSLVRSTAPSSRKKAEYT